MDKKSWLQKLEVMEQEQQGTSRSEPEESRPRDFLEGRGKLLILGGIGVVVLVLLVIVFFPGQETISERQLQDIPARLDVLGSRLAGLENLEVGRQQSLVRMQGDFNILTMRVDKLAQEMKEQFAAVAARREQPAAVAAQPKPQAIALAQPAAAKPVLHEVSAGETLFRISRTYGVTVDEIRRLNKLAPNDLIHPGQVLTIKR